MEDLWDYDRGKGGGRTRVWENADENGALEKAGVNFSCVSSSKLPQAATEAHTLDSSAGFTATGVSLVIHPRNPHAPTIHMNVRYFESEGTWWFGGGIDLTPYYPELADVVTFHKKLSDVCNAHGMPYQEYKEYCDRYFFLEHRNETRGVGGLFFESLNSESMPDKSKTQLFHFVRDLGMAFVDIYRPLLIPNLAKAVSDDEREFQLLRRARYVEFNLLFDRGTKFGIQSKARTESILMSLPSVAHWRYNWKPEPGSREEQVIDFFLKPQDWLSLKQ